MQQLANYYLPAGRFRFEAHWDNRAGYAWVDLLTKPHGATDWTVRHSFANGGGAIALVVEACDVRLVTRDPNGALRGRKVQHSHRPLTTHEIATPTPTRPAGRSGDYPWPGGEGIVELRGNFRGAEAAAAHVTLFGRTQRADGKFDGPRAVATFTSAGEHSFRAPPGELYFQGSGIPNLEVLVDKVVRPSKKPPTVEERLRALEQRVTSTEPEAPAKPAAAMH